MNIFGHVLLVANLIVVPKLSRRLEIFAHYTKKVILLIEQHKNGCFDSKGGIFQRTTSHVAVDQFFNENLVTVLRNDPRQSSREVDNNFGVYIVN